MSLTSDVRGFLEERRFAVLATLFPDGRIQQSVMWYELRGDTIIMNTAAGRVKDQNIRRDPRVALCWEEGYKYLAIDGVVREVIDDQAISQPDVFGLAQRYNPDLSPVEIDRRFSNFKQEQRETLVISIDNVVANGF